MWDGFEIRPTAARVGRILNPSYGRQKGPGGDYGSRRGRFFDSSLLSINIVTIGLHGAGVSGIS
jgi:hypothetical protein